MAEEQEEINPHILRPEDPGSTPASNEGVPPKAFEPSHSHLTFPHSQPFTTPLSHPEPATVEIYDTPATRAYRMTSRKMGNVVMQSSGDSTDQYVILIGNIPWREKWQDLKDLVRRITPNVERAEIYSSKDGRSRGFGYVRVKGLREAEKVKDALDGFEWHGRALVTKLGNLKYGCPVGGSSMTGLEQSDPKTLPHATNFPYQPPHPVDVISIDEPYKHLPPEFQDPPAISRSLPSNANPLDIEAHYHHTYVQAYMQHLAKASYHFGKANDLFKAMDELWRHGRVDILEEYQRQFYIHRDIGNQANNQAVNAHQLAAEHFERFNQLRLATAGGSIPVQNISDPYPLPYLNLPVPVYQGPMMGSASTGSQSTFRSVSDTGVNTGNLVISHPNAPGPFLMPFNPEYPHITPSPVYVTPPNGLPVNLAHGAVRTECRSVFIGNLPYDTTWRELKEYLETCIRVDVPRNVDNRAKGYATAIFETPEGAEQACLRFNNSIFKGRPIRVKMDKFCATKLGPDTTIGGPGRGEQSERAAGPVERSAGSAHSPDASVYTAPVVVDGSTSITMKGCKDKSVG